MVAKKTEANALARLVQVTGFAPVIAFGRTSVGASDTVIRRVIGDQDVMYAVVPQVNGRPHNDGLKEFRLIVLPFTAETERPQLVPTRAKKGKHPGGPTPGGKRRLAEAMRARWARLRKFESEQQAGSAA